MGGKRPKPPSQPPAEDAYDELLDEPGYYGTSTAGHGSAEYYQHDNTGGALDGTAHYNDYVDPRRGFYPPDVAQNQNQGGYDESDTAGQAADPYDDYCKHRKLRSQCPKCLQRSGQRQPYTETKDARGKVPSHSHQSQRGNTCTCGEGCAENSGCRSTDWKAYPAYQGVTSRSQNTPGYDGQYYDGDYHQPNDGFEDYEEWGDITEEKGKSDKKYQDNDGTGQSSRLLAPESKSRDRSDTTRPSKDHQIKSSKSRDSKHSYSKGTRTSSSKDVQERPSRSSAAKSSTEGTYSKSSRKQSSYDNDSRYYSTPDHGGSTDPASYKGTAYGGDYGTGHLDDDFGTLHVADDRYGRR